jgi:hypothetical protein
MRRRGQRPRAVTPRTCCEGTSAGRTPSAWVRRRTSTLARYTIGSDRPQIMHSHQHGGHAHASASAHTRAGPTLERAHLAVLLAGVQPQREVGHVTDAVQRLPPAQVVLRATSMGAMSAGPRPTPPPGGGVLARAGARRRTEKTGFHLRSAVRHASDEHERVATPAASWYLTIRLFTVRETLLRIRDSSDCKPPSSPKLPLPPARFVVLLLAPPAPPTTLSGRALAARPFHAHAQSL